MSIDWYCRTYACLIETRKYRGLDKSKLDGYYEKHHIIPKCLGGKDKASNLVLLTYREHVIAHMKLVKACTRMLLVTVIDESSGKKVKKELPLRKLEEIRELYIKSCSGENNPNFGKKGKDAAHYGHKQSKEARDKISRANKGRLVGEKNPMYGVKLVGEKNPMYGKYKGNHPAAKKVIDKNGKIFNSLTECAEYHNLDRHTIMNYIKKKPEKGFKYL